MSSKTMGQRVLAELRKTTVEPFLFFVMFGYNIKLISMQSLLHERACRVSLGFNHTVCENLESEDYDAVQSYALKYGNNLYNAFVMISTIPALIIATFLGPWSDRYSRKYPLILACSGILLDSILQVFVTAFRDASPTWFLFCAIFSGICGGYIIIISSTYSYMSDVTDEKSRQIRYAILEFYTIMATPLGSFIGGQVQAKYGYLAVMIISPCSFALALLWLLLYVVETKPRRFDISKKQMLQEVFKLDNMKESFQTSVKPRAGNIRLQIWLLIIVSMSLRFINLGSLSIGFPFARKEFKWKIQRYSYTTTSFSLLNAFVTLAIVPILNKRLYVHEAAVGLVGVLSLMTKMVIMSVTVFEGLIFYAWLSGCLYACGGIAVRSRISKLVSRNELGKVFSLVATFESPMPVVGTVVLTQIYNSSLDIYPPLPYAVAAVILIPSAAIFAWMMHLPTMSLVQFEESEERKNMKELKNVSSNVF